MTWIATVSYDDADERVRRLYDRVTGPGGNVDNIMMMHSLRPHTMEGHLALYKNVLPLSQYGSGLVPGDAGRVGQLLEQLRLLRRAPLRRAEAPAG